MGAQRLAIWPGDMCREMAMPKFQSQVVLLSEVQVQLTCLALPLGENNTWFRRRGPLPAQEWLLGNSLAVQWLGLGAFTAGAQVQSLVGKLRSCKPCGMAKKKRNGF